jgi:osmotically-inducible protein OsmY
VERIRSKMGHFLSQPGAIQVTAKQGRVTLSGEIYDNEVTQLLSTVNELGGVQSVTNELKTHPQGQDLPGFPTTAQTA